MSALNKYGELEEGNCPKCGKPIKPDWKACPSCGHSFDRKTVTESHNQNAAQARTLLKQLQTAVNEYSALEARRGLAEEAVNQIYGLKGEEWLDELGRIEQKFDASSKRILELIERCKCLCRDLEINLGMSVRESAELEGKCELLKWSKQGVQSRLDYYRAKILN